MYNLQSIKIVDDSPKIGNMVSVISVCTLHFVVTSVSQKGEIYLYNSQQVQYCLPEDNGIPTTLHRLWRLLFERFKLMYKNHSPQFGQFVYKSRTTGTRRVFVWHMIACDWFQIISHAIQNVPYFCKLQTADSSNRKVSCLRNRKYCIQNHNKSKF
jgi:hypothetical protein